MLEPVRKLTKAASVIAMFAALISVSPFTASAETDGLTPGDEIHIGSHRCSVGPIVVLKDNSPGFLTSGHCGDVGSAVDWASVGGSYHAIGVIEDKRYANGGSPYTDFALVRLKTNDIRPVLGGKYRISTYLTPAELNESMSQGGTFEACSIGFRSIERCGGLKSLESDGEILAGFKTVHGESGGPAYVRSSGKGNNVAVIGITNGTLKSDPSKSVIMPIETILNTFGIRLYIGG